MNTNLIPAISNILIGILFFAMSAPLMKKKVKINDIYGFRTSKAFESEENWYNINAYFGKKLSVCSTLVVIVGIVCFFVPVKESLNIIISAGPIVLSLIFSVVTTLNYEHGL